MRRSNLSSYLDNMEISLIPNIQQISVRHVGCKTWTEQHNILSKLNIAAHLQIQTEKPETIVAEIISQHKTGDILQHLLVMETWKTNVFPKISSYLEKTDSVRGYFMLYHEATAINLVI